MIKFESTTDADLALIAALAGMVANGSPQPESVMQAAAEISKEATADLVRRCVTPPTVKIGNDDPYNCGIITCAEDNP